jgi:hypothetical protein
MVSRRSVQSSAVASERLEDLGFRLEEEPERVMPRLPEDLTELGDEDLMQLFTRFVQWQTYAASQLSLAEIREADLLDALGVEEARATIAAWPDNPGRDDRVSIAKAHRDQDPVVVEHRESARLAKAKRKMLATYTDNLERKAALVSRELTRRVNVEDFRKRSDRWSPG